MFQSYWEPGITIDSDSDGSCLESTICELGLMRKKKIKIICVVEIYSPWLAQLYMSSWMFLWQCHWRNIGNVKMTQHIILESVVLFLVVHEVSMVRDFCCIVLAGLTTQPKVDFLTWKKVFQKNNSFWCNSPKIVDISVTTISIFSATNVFALTQTCTRC